MDVTNPPTFRESACIGGVGWSMAAWSAGFAINVVLAADYLTSPQWRALMTIPGGKWFWTALFGGAALMLLVGLIGDGYRLRAVGLGLMGAGSAGIALFYILAPIFDLGPITFGYWPWFVPVGIGLFGSVVNWWPIPWF